MPKKLTLPQQRALIKALPSHRINDVKTHCGRCVMRGEGVMDIIKSISSVLGPIAKELGPTVLKELILPFIKKKMGSGLSPPGGALRLAGQRGKGKKKVGRPKSKKGGSCGCVGAGADLA